MLRSMTGYGNDSIRIGSMTFTVEIRSVNHRYCEIVVRMPRQWFRMEEKLRKLAASRVHRGRVELVVSAERADGIPVQPQLDVDLAAAYVDAAERLKGLFGDRLRDGAVSAAELLQVPGVFAPEDPAKLPEDAEDRLLACAESALNKLAAMREAEGRFLAEDMAAKLRHVEDAVRRMRDLSAAASDELRARLREKVAELLGGMEAVDEARLAAEIVYYAERSAIDEELTRLSSHIAQFGALLQSREPAGRKLDFLLQEMNRETNTIGSKAGNAEIAAIVVNVKAELEKLREQAQNIE